ncbi:MAG: hypothetical protein COY81_01295, partial [Candidatus Pacebacteria bacterium CG_4_10_14_0_8_um_filter_43_12]
MFDWTSGVGADFLPKISAGYVLWLIVSSIPLLVFFGPYTAIAVFASARSNPRRSTLDCHVIPLRLHDSQ